MRTSAIRQIAALVGSSVTPGGTFGYTVAFAISAAVLVAAGILCGALIPKHLAPPTTPADTNSPAAASNA